jgi:hypothetical protein
MINLVEKGLPMRCRDRGRMWGWEGALCLSAWPLQVSWFGETSQAPQDADRHKAPSQPLPHPLSLQDEATLHY